jgi:hypothetical protein
MVKFGLAVKFFADCFTIWPYRHYPPSHPAYQLAHQITPYYTVDLTPSDVQKDKREIKQKGKGK